MDVTVIRSNRKSVAIQVNPDMTVTVRAPKRASMRDIERLLREKEPWIRKHIQKLQDANEKFEAEGAQYLTADKIRELTLEAKAVIPERVSYFSGIIGVDYGRITIRHQKTRWGSCSSQGNLNFNCLLMMAPPEVIDYVVVHELCHRKEMNHSKSFWHEVEKVLPDYKKSVKWLKDSKGMFRYEQS